MIENRNASGRSVWPMRANWPEQAALRASADHEVLVMSRVPGRDPIGGIRGVDHDNLRRGVRYRIVVPDTARAEPVDELEELSLAGARVRVVADVPTDALVVDGSVVVLREGPGTAAFRLPSVVTTTTELFERVWSSAEPLAADDPSDTADLGARERDLLTLLSAGSTDESAAVRLGVSVRTVRRMVSDLMQQLGARSRFQAGARAAGRGWLMERAG